MMFFALFLLLISFKNVVLLKEYCIIGAGPSGLQMAYFLEKNNRDYVIFERHSAPGWFFQIYPRQRNLISLNKRYTGKSNKEFNMRHDWNSLLSDDPNLLMTRYSKKFFPAADTLVRYLQDFASKLKLKIQYNTCIKNVSKTDNTTYVLTDKNETIYQCKNLIVSTGMWVENIPKFSGIEHTVGYPTMSTNPDDYEGKTVLVLGRGNSGFETAQSLMGAANLIHMVSKSRVKFSWETHYVGDVRAVNCGPIDTYQLKSLDGQVEGDLTTMSFKKNNGKIYVTFSDEVQLQPDNLATREGYDAVLRCLGFKFDRSIFDMSIRPKKSDVAKKYPAINENYESTTSKGMFFTGVATHSLDWRKSAGGFIHGFRYTTRALARYLEWRNHGVHWPSITLSNSDLMNVLLKRLNEASGIYQMFSALTDVIAFRDNDTFEYFQEVPVGMLHTFEENTGRPFKRGIVVNLEYGKNFSGPGSDPFREDRATGDPQVAHFSNFLHPVLYYYDDGIPAADKLGLPKPKRLHHMVEDFLTEWLTPSSHILPLRWFLEYCIGADMRKFYAESCFEYSMTGMEPPPTCSREYLHGLGLSRAATISA